MIKDRLIVVRDFAVRNSKLVFPVILIAAVATTVTLALRAGNEDALDSSLPLPEELSLAASPTPEPEADPKDTTMEMNTNGELYTLIATYYNAFATGDVETIKSISTYMEETEEIRIPEMSKYVESYPYIEIYTKPGPRENSYLAYVYFHMTLTSFEEEVPGMDTFYVCTNEDGSLYLNTDEVVPDTELEYIREMNLQDDVVELNNQTNVECKEIFLENADLFYYVQELVTDVKSPPGRPWPPRMAGQQSLLCRRKRAVLLRTMGKGSSPWKRQFRSPLPERLPPLSMSVLPTVSRRRRSVKCLAVQRCQSWRSS